MPMKPHKKRMLNPVVAGPSLLLAFSQLGSATCLDETSYDSGCGQEGWNCNAEYNTEGGLTSVSWYGQSSVWRSWCSIGKYTDDSLDVQESDSGTGTSLSTYGSYVNVCDVWKGGMSHMEGAFGAGSAECTVFDSTNGSAPGSCQ